MKQKKLLALIDKFGDAPTIYAEITDPNFDESSWDGDPELMAELRKTKKINSAYFKKKKLANDLDAYKKKIKALADNS